MGELRNELYEEIRSLRAEIGHVGNEVANLKGVVASMSERISDIAAANNSILSVIAGREAASKPSAAGPILPTPESVHAPGFEIVR